MEHYLRPLLAPRSVALVSATEREDALGAIVYRNLAAGALHGELYAVNLKHGTVFGRPAYRRLGELPQPPDAAVIVTPARPGRLALVSQSGAVCTAILDWARRAQVGFSSVVSLGGAADVDFGEVLDFLVADRAADSILLYIEGVHDARRFVSAPRAGARSRCSRRGWATSARTRAARCSRRRASRISTHRRTRSRRSRSCAPGGATAAS